MSRLPIDPGTPVVVSVPHAGVATGLLGEPLTPGLDIRCDGDLFVDELYGPAASGAFVAANFSRFICDLNRHPDDVSSRAVPSHPAPRNSDGRGFIWEVTTTGSPAQHRSLSLSEWEARKNIHTAYYDALGAALKRAKTKFGFAILVDGHSMPSTGRAGHADPGRPRADFVPGDRSGTSCDTRLSHLVGDHFENQGFTVAFNDPYKGGFITQHHGHPEDGIHAIQIEMRRDLYMHEMQFERDRLKWPRVADAIAGLLHKLDALTLR